MGSESGGDGAREQPKEEQVEQNEEEAELQKEDEELKEEQQGSGNNDKIREGLETELKEMREKEEELD